MVIIIVILLVLFAALGIALYFQMKAAKEQAEEGQQLLKDYQKRVDEMEKLLKDYRELEQNFDSVGQGYEQALLAFDKIEEERQTTVKVKETLEKQANDLLAAKNKLEQSLMKKKDLIQQAADSLKAKIDPANTQAIQLVNQILNFIHNNMLILRKKVFLTA